MPSDFGDLSILERTGGGTLPPTIDDLVVVYHYVR